MTEKPYTNAEALLSFPAVLQEDFETMRGAHIRLQGMTRTQVLRLREMAGDKNFEPTMLVFGVAEPKLTLAEAQTWEDSAPAGELQEVTDKIYSLSGMDDDAGKQAYKSVRGQS